MAGDYPALTESVGFSARAVRELEEEVFENIQHMDKVRMDPLHSEQCPKAACIHARYAVALWNIVDICLMLKKHPRLSSAHFTCTVGDCAAVNAFVSRTRAAMGEMSAWVR